MDSIKKIPEKIWEEFRKNKIQYFLLLIILIVGIGFRVYHLHDFTRFSDDEARDAGIIRDIIEHKAPLPLLGPVAGKTHFYLGPAYYYILYAGAKIYGAGPAQMAYPAVIFGILAIPLLYFFFKKYFGRNLSLTLTALFALSFFVVRYARFGWNPNITPFFTLLFLYALFELTRRKGKLETFWAISAGVALGIGAQLHTVFLGAAPLTLILFFIWGRRKKIFSWKSAAVIVAVAILLNVPQLVSEFQTKGKNTKGLVEALLDPSTSINLKKTTIDAACQVQMNSAMVSSYGYQDDCSFLIPRLDVTRFFEVILPDKEKGRSTLNFQAIGMYIFTLGGYILLLWYKRREKDPEKRRYLVLSLMFISMAFIVLIPVIRLADARYFVFQEFVPFLLLGVWIKFILDKIHKYVAAVLLLALVGFPAYLNVWANRDSFDKLAGQQTYAENLSESTTLGEEEYIANYILAHRGDAQIAFIKGGGDGLFKIMKPIQYFFRNVNDFDVERMRDDDSKLRKVFFKVDLVGGDLKKNWLGQTAFDDWKVLNVGTFGRYVVYQVEFRSSVKP